MYKMKKRILDSLLWSFGLTIALVLVEWFSGKMEKDQIPIVAVIFFVVVSIGELSIRCIRDKRISEENFDEFR